MKLVKIRRSEKKGTESVMDEKFTLLFVCTLSGHNFEIKVRIHNLIKIYLSIKHTLQGWTISLPVVVIVHGNQEPQSWATITWDNSFSLPNRMPFEVPEHVQWQHLSNTLNKKFISMTDRSLTPENMCFLCKYNEN